MCPVKLKLGFRLLGIFSAIIQFTKDISGQPIVPTPVGTPESIDKIGCLPHTIPRNPSPSLTSKNTSECK